MTNCAIPTKATGRPCKSEVDVLPCPYHDKETFDAIIGMIRAGDFVIIRATDKPNNVVNWVNEAGIMGRMVRTDKGATK